MDEELFATSAVSSVRSCGWIGRFALEELAGKVSLPLPARESRPATVTALTVNPSDLALVALLDEVVHEFARGVVHLDVESFDAAAEVVEGHNRGDRDEQAERGGYEGF